VTRHRRAEPCDRVSYDTSDRGFTRTGPLQKVGRFEYDKDNNPTQMEFPGFSGQTLASGFSRRSYAEVQAPDPWESANRQIAALERQLALRQQNSTISSKPPSSDGLAGRRREPGRRNKSRRKPGGQLGHPGHCRPLVPPNRVNARVDVFPNACRHCNHARPACGQTVTGEPRRHQVTDVAPVDAHITDINARTSCVPRAGR
jgi:Family of unknown function (DUF6444)